MKHATNTPQRGRTARSLCFVKGRWILTWMCVRHVKTRGEQKHKDEMGLRLRINNKRKMKSGQACSERKSPTRIGMKMNSTHYDLPCERPTKGVEH